MEAETSEVRDTSEVSTHRRNYIIKGVPTMFGFGLPELSIVLIIVTMIFGVGRLPELGGAMGKTIRNFRKASEGKDEIEIKAKEA